MSADLIERLRAYNPSAKLIDRLREHDLAAYPEDDDWQDHYCDRADELLKEAADRIAALEASDTEGERRGWLAAVDALDEIAKAMAEKAEALRSPDPFAVATSEEADAAVHGWVLERAATLLRERIPPFPARKPSHEPR